MEYTAFTTDKEKMRDFKILTKKEFLKSYSYITEAEYNLTVEQNRRIKFMDKTIKSQVIECETIDGGGILVALGDDKFANDFSAFCDNDYDPNFNRQMYDIDCKVWNCFTFGEYEEIQKPKDLIGKSICIHDREPIDKGDTITKINLVENAEDYFNYQAEV